MRGSFSSGSGSRGAHGYQGQQWAPSVGTTSSGSSPMSISSSKSHVRSVSQPSIHKFGQLASTRLLFRYYGGVIIWECAIRP